jgi:glycopeptide antibiotics resistance protein
LVGLLIQQAYAIAAAPLVMAALLLGGVVAGAGAQLVARRRGWRAIPAVLSGFGLTLILAMTVVRLPLPRYQELGTGAGATPFCVIDGFGLFNDENAILNMWLFVPFALFAMLATDRAVGVLGSSVVLTGAIELTQPIAGIGVCQTQDFFNNVLGAVLGVAGGWLLSALARR